MKLNVSCFVEKLTVFNFCFYILPYVISRRFKKNKQVWLVCFIDATPSGQRVARLVLGWWHIPLERLNFRMADIRDDQGNMVYLKVRLEDFPQVQAAIVDDPQFQAILNSSQDGQNGDFGFYLKRQSAAFTWDDGSNTLRMLFLIRVICQKTKDTQAENYERVFFACRRLWQKQLKDYALKWDVEVRFTPRIQWQGKALFMRCVGRNRSRAFYYHYLLFGFKGLMRKAFTCWAGGDNSDGHKEKIAPMPENSKVMVDYYGNFNLQHPQLLSDLFFCHHSSIPGKDVVLSYNLPNNPIDQCVYDEIKARQMSIIALNPRATKVAAVPVFQCWSDFDRKKVENYASHLTCPPALRTWVVDQAINYQEQFHYWKKLLTQENIKVFVTWFKYSAWHSVIADVLRDMGGASLMYQRSFEIAPLPVTAINTDVFFAFSKATLDTERASGSLIRYGVITGFLGDYRFDLLRPTAQQVRQKIHQHGAKKIIAFFDEGSGPDPRWHTGHEFMRANYSFLLEKLLADPCVGIVFKPKDPFSLRKRLGPVADVLAQAEATGRCFIFGEGNVYPYYTPAVAALAGDIAIHGNFSAVTAGLEAALTGTPTLMLDREGYSRGELHSLLSQGRIIFRDWQSLWQACEDFWARPGHAAGLGNWSGVLPYFDPFQDGRAAQRMGTYLNWLLEGFKAGLPRETVLADAAGRYRRQYGEDKIIVLEKQGIL